MTVLDDILDGVRADVAGRMERVPLDTLKERASHSPPAGPGVKFLCRGIPFGLNPFETTNGSFHASG